LFTWQIKVALYSRTNSQGKWIKVAPVSSSFARLSVTCESVITRSWLGYWWTVHGLSTPCNARETPSNAQTNVLWLAYKSRL